MEIVVLMAVMGVTCAAFYIQAKTARRAKNNTMRLLAEVNAEKQEMLNDLRVLVRPLDITIEEKCEFRKVLDKWQRYFGGIRIEVDGRELTRRGNQSVTI